MSNKAMKNTINIALIIAAINSNDTQAINRELLPVIREQEFRTELTTEQKENKKKRELEMSDKLTREHKVDYNFIIKVEGYRKELYVPNRNGVVIGKSGATVGVGVDIGQHSESDFVSMGIPKTIRDKVRPFFGIKGQAALEYLSKNPVTLTDEEAKLLSKLVIDNKIRQISAMYNKESKLKFSDIPANIQTVIISLSYQYGSLKHTKFVNANKLWKLAVDGDWEGFERLLRNFGDKYAIRRRKEAELVLEAIK